MGQQCRPGWFAVDVAEPHGVVAPLTTGAEATEPEGGGDRGPQVGVAAADRSESKPSAARNRATPRIGTTARPTTRPATPRPMNATWPARRPASRPRRSRGPNT